MVPGVGLEPTSLAAGDFKSPVYTIPPPGQGDWPGREWSRVTKSAQAITPCAD